MCSHQASVSNKRQRPMAIKHSTNQSCKDQKQPANQIQSKGHHISSLSHVDIKSWPKNKGQHSIFRPAIISFEREVLPCTHVEIQQAHKVAAVWKLNCILDAKIPHAWRGNRTQHSRKGAKRTHHWADVPRHVSLGLFNSFKAIEEAYTKKKADCYMGLLGWPKNLLHGSEPDRQQTWLR